MDKDKELVTAIHRLELRMLEGLAKNTAQLATHTSKLDEHCDKIDTLFDKQERLDKTVYGVGGESDGIATRMAVMEDHEESRKRVVWGLGGIALPGFLQLIYDFFKSH